MPSPALIMPFPVLARPGRRRRVREPGEAAAGAYRGKRLLDLAVGLVASLAALPLLPLIALAIRLDSPGPIFFCQSRVGQNGRIFRLIKFRSMRVGAEAERAELAHRNEVSDGVLFKLRRDPRVTRVGAWLRRSSLDELPQLLNVLVGDMSLVGPRPALPEEVLEYSEEHRSRLAVKPGLTCHWQVMGRSELPFQEQMRLDVRYVAGCSLATDVALLARTVPAVLTMRGAY